MSGTYHAAGRPTKSKSKWAVGAPVLPPEKPSTKTSVVRDSDTTCSICGAILPTWIRHDHPECIRAPDPHPDPPPPVEFDLRKELASLISCEPEDVDERELELIHRYAEYVIRREIYRMVDEMYPRPEFADMMRRRAARFRDER